jgi:hypothetical protein
MNKELLNTPVVKGSIKRYLELGLNLEEILNKLLDIHLIIITKKELSDFIEENLNRKNIKQKYSSTKTEECFIQCEECGIYYNKGSCMIFNQNPKITKFRLCEICFEKLSKQIDENHK